jgi:hypothetical protein
VILRKRNIIKLNAWKVVFRPRDWYVSNVSIIFDAPCLFLHHLPCVSLHFMAFYAIFGTNLLTRCHSASSLFSAIFVFKKCYIGNILGIGRNKFQNSYFSRTKDEDRKRAGGGPGASLTLGQRGPGPGRAPYVWGAPGSPLTMPLRLYKASGTENPKGVDEISRTVP